MKYSLLIAFFVSFIASITASTAYEYLWESTLNKHSKQTTISGKTYIYINQESLKESQTFINLTRIMNHLNTSKFTQNESIAFLINQYNINAIKNNIKDACITSENISENLNKYIQKDTRLLFTLGNTAKESPNIYAYRSDTLENQLTEATTQHLKKMITINSSTKSIKINNCLTQLISDTSTIETLIKSYSKKRDLTQYTFYYQSSNIVKP